MANPAVEKLKGVALQFGDKVAVALCALLFLAFLVLSLAKPTIDTTPDQIEQISSSARSNLTRTQDERSILDKLSTDGMVPQDFEKTVVTQEKRQANVEKVALVRPFVRTEPGAGLIREDVKSFLPAPYELFATAGRGGVIFYERDASGNVIPVDPNEKPAANLGMMSGGRGSMGMSGMSMSPGGGGAQTKSDVEEQARKKQAELAKQKALQGIAGKASGKEEPSEEEEELALASDYKTETKGQMYAAIIGLINHKQLRDQYAKALKVEFTQANPDYVRVDIERQVYDPVVGDWSDWATVDRQRNEETLQNVAFQEDEKEELTLQASRLEPLVSFLPYLTAGYWTGVHHGEVIDPDKLEEIEASTDVASNTNSGGGAFGYPGGGPGMMSGGPGMMSGGPGMMSGGPGMMSGGPGMMSGGPGMMSSGGSMYPGMDGSGRGMMGGGSSGPQVEFVSDAETLMVRAIDLTVEADTIYRYRLRIVVNNPNYNRDDVAPGVDNKTKELLGPWSEATEAVPIPAQVAVFAMSPGRDAGGNTSADQIVFDVIAWNPSTGVTAFKQFTAGPGEIIGRPSDTLIPLEGEEKPKNMTVNFNSRQLIFDTMGGLRPVQNLGLVGPPLEIPAVALLLRPDGTISVRSQATDRDDEQHIFMRDTYLLSISEEKNKKKKGNMLGMYGGMGGDASGMYGGMSGMYGGSQP